MELTPKYITERHKIWPDATETLIQFYANVAAKKKIEKLIGSASVTKMQGQNLIVIVAHGDLWEEFTRNDIYKGININILEEAEKHGNNTKI
jgi:hypothetical protein